MRKYFNFVFLTSMVACLLQIETFIPCKSKVNISPNASERVTCKAFLSDYTCLLLLAELFIDLSYAWIACL